MMFERTNVQHGHAARPETMEHFAPHPNAQFEGFYSKFSLPSGAHIALIICTIPAATTHPPHMVSFTYYSASGTTIFQREHWASSIERNITGPGHAFELRVPGLGIMSVDADSTTRYDFECKEWTLQGKTVSHTPWSRTKSTPEGWMVNLPLPLHWHVHSLASLCRFALAIPEVKLEKMDLKGCAIVHQEKNWASSFPESHMWVQARDSNGERGVCLAGGKILGMTAYILGYRSPNLNFDFAPPFSLSVFNWSPFMSVDVDWDDRKFEISVAGLWRKLVVRTQAPKEMGWFGLAAPFREGHLKNSLAESFVAAVEVEIWEREWSTWGAWREKRREQFEGASLEFGGGYYPDRGEKRE